MKYRNKVPELLEDGDSDLGSSFDDKVVNSSIDMTQSSFREGSMKRSNTLDKNAQIPVANINREVSSIEMRRQNSDLIKKTPEGALSPSVAERGRHSVFAATQKSAKISVNNLEDQSFDSAPDKNEDSGNNIGEHLL